MAEIRSESLEFGVSRIEDLSPLIRICVSGSCHVPPSELVLKYMTKDCLVIYGEKYG